MTQPRLLPHPGADQLPTMLGGFPGMPPRWAGKTLSWVGNAARRMDERRHRPDVAYRGRSKGEQTDGAAGRMPAGGGAAVKPEGESTGEARKSGDQAWVKRDCAGGATEPCYRWQHFQRAVAVREAAGLRGWPQGFPCAQPSRSTSGECHRAYPRWPVSVRGRQEWKRQPAR